MRILVYGAGVQGCELAHRLLQNKKNVVTMLARGEWKERLDQRGLVIRHWAQCRTTVDRVATIDTLAPDDCYDLVFVTLQAGQLPGLQRHENEVVAVVRGQRVDGGHPIHRGAALRPVADDEAPLVEPLLPLAPRQHGDDILFVLQQTVGQLTALYACTIDQYPHLCLPPYTGPSPGPEVISASKTRRSPSSHTAFPLRRSQYSPCRRWQPSGPRCPAAGPRR